MATNKTDAPKMVRNFPIDRLRVDAVTQARVALDPDTIEEYGSAYAKGRKMPALDAVFHDEKAKAWWVADGQHRCEGARAAGKKTIDVMMYEGTLQDAQWYAAGANPHHGLKRTNEDKRRAVKLALGIHPEHSDGVLADHCGVGERFVSKVRADLTPHGAESTARVGKDGRTINTAKIGEANRQRADAKKAAASAGSAPEMAGPVVPDAKGYDDQGRFPPWPAADERAERPRRAAPHPEFDIDTFLANNPDHLPVAEDLGDVSPEDSDDAFERAVMGGDDVGARIVADSGAPVDEDPPHCLADEERVTITPAGRAALVQASQPPAPATRPTSTKDAPKAKKSGVLTTTDSERNPFPAAMLPVVELMDDVAAQLGGVLAAAEVLWAKFLPLIADVTATTAGRYLPAEMLKPWDARLGQKGPASFHGLRSTLDDLRPSMGVICPDCSGEGCTHCGSRGWLTKTQWRRAKEHDKALDKAGLGELKEGR